MIDNDDREFLAQAVFWIIAVFGVALLGAGILGLAVRVFSIAAG